MIYVRRRAAAFARIIALFSAIWTALLAALVVGWQGFALARTGEWMPFPVSRVLALAALEETPVYSTASVPSSNTSPADLSGVAGWLLDLPASGVLVFVAAIMLAFSASLGLLEKQLDAGEE